MSPTSTAGLPRLERLLLDNDINLGIRPLLEALGFSTVVAYQVVDVTSDALVVRYARENGLIVVTHDGYDERYARVNANREIWLNGGRVIQVSGRADQDLMLCVGKIVMHRKWWREQFAEFEDGIAKVHEQGHKFLDRDRLRRTIPQVALDPDLDPSVTQLRGPIKRVRRRKRIKPPRSGAPLFVYESPEQST